MRALSRSQVRSDPAARLLQSRRLVRRQRRARGAARQPVRYSDLLPSISLFAQLEAMKQLARRSSPRRIEQDDQNADGQNADGQNAGVEPVTTRGKRSPASSATPNQVDPAALMRQIGELFTRLPSHFPTAN